MRMVEIDSTKTLEVSFFFLQFVETVIFSDEITNEKT